MKKLLLLAAVGIMLTACKNTEYITVPEIHEVHHHHTDSIKQTDSVTVEKETVIMQLDSAAMAQYGIQLKSAERAWLVKTAELERRLQQLIENHTDTVHERDSVPYPVEVIKEVPAKLTWWQQMRIHFANIVLWVLAIAVIAIILTRFWLKRPIRQSTLVDVLHVKKETLKQNRYGNYT